VFSCGIDDDGEVRAVIAIALVACGRIDFGATGSGDASSGDASSGDGPAADANDAVVIVSDDFGRSMAGGWGSADVGGLWLDYNPDNSTIGVGSGRGSVGLTSTTGYADLHVPSTTALDTETRVVVSFDQIPTTGSYTATLSARWVANGTDYRLHADVLAGGALDVYIDRGSGSYVEIAAGNTNLVASADVGVAMSFVATGASPTTFCGKVWLANSSEPTACTVSGQDSTPELQVPGISYVDTYDTDDTPPTVSFATFRFLRVGPE
jgi:large repetitive protein